MKPFFCKKLAGQLRLCLLVMVLCLVNLVSQAQDNIIYPAGASPRYTDVTKSPYNADKTGTVDATAAIQAAFNAGARIVYLPNGTYLVSSTIRWKGDDDNNGQKRQILQGQSRNGTVIKLKDNTPLFGSTATPQPVIYVGRKPAQRFSNGIRNLTVNTGIGNPGAIGTQFIANNQGGMDRVLIKSGDGNGIYGLDLGYTDEQGPCLIKNLEVQGFNVGVRTKFGADGVVLYNILVRDQKQYGVQNDGQCLSVESLTAVGTVTGLINNGEGVVSLINSTFTGSGAASGVPAIINNNGLFARNIVTLGFQKAITNNKGGSESTAQNLTEFVSHPVLSLYTSVTQSLNLTVRPTPEVAWGDTANWVNVGSYPPTVLPDGKLDYTSAVQQAIDSGKETVYFGSAGVFTGTVYVRGNVRRIIGMDAWTTSDFSTGGTFIIDNGTAPVVVIENFMNQYNEFKIIHRSSRSVVLRKLFATDVSTEAGAGNLFIEDIYSGSVRIAPGTSVYARQLDSEGELNPKILNQGTLWVMGIKSENDRTIIQTNTGGKTEVLGGFIYANKSSNPDKVMFLTGEGAQFSGTIGESVIRNQPFRPGAEIREGLERVMPVGYAPKRGGGSMLPLYTAIRPTATAVPNNVPNTLAGTAPRYNQIKLTWADNVTNEDGFLLERKAGSGSFTACYLTNMDGTAFNDSLLAPATTYQYRLRAVNSLGKSNYSNTVTITTPAAPPIPATPTNFVASLQGATAELSWTDNATNESNYRLERRSGTDTAYVFLATLPANATLYSDASLRASTTYQYRLRAYFEISNSASVLSTSLATGAATELVVNWRLDEKMGNRAGDASGRGVVGSLGGGVTFSTSAVAGIQKAALLLDGIDDKVQGTDNDRFVDGYPFSIAVWVKTSSLAQGTALYLGDKDRNDMYYLLGTNTTGQAVLESSYGSNVKRVVGPVITDDKWHLLTGVFERVGSHKLFVDGQLKATLTDSVSFHKYMTRFTVGAKDGISVSTRMKGAFDETRLYSRALSATEVTNLYTALATPQCGTVNQALNRSATSSTYNGATFSPGNAIDGNPATRWASARGDVQSFKIDLGSAKPITCLNLRWANDYGVAYRIDISTDNATWTTVYSTTAGVGGTVAINGLSATVRYVRMSGTKQGPTANGYSLTEFEVLGSPSGSPRVGSPEPTDEGQSRVLVFPNPSDGNLSVRLVLPQSVPVEFNLIDMNGRSVLLRNVQGVAGENNVDLQTKRVPGVYLLHVLTPDRREVKKVLIE